MFDNPNWNDKMRQAYDPLYMGYRLPKYEVIKVNGEAGAKGFQMAPNSSIILAECLFISVCAFIEASILSLSQLKLATLGKIIFRNKGNNYLFILIIFIN